MERERDGRDVECGQAQQREGSVGGAEKVDKTSLGYRVAATP